MAMRWSLLVPASSILLASWILPAASALATPITGGMAEREPPAAVLWITLLTIAGLSLAMSCRRWWLPLMLWVPVAFAVSLIIAELADPVIGAAIREELGGFYVLQADLCAALAIIVPLAFANSRFDRQDVDKRRNRRLG
ncbi:hypothetical protein GCM10028812_37100 [Ancylobacter sonchi]|uniref:hypothetical protein n=1 Tax=Ancylobacter sonchi TaxID=1937790 RepID=UPI001FE52E96|nr:hypothetical protein [Ancylobacter sonchi]